MLQGVTILTLQRLGSLSRGGGEYRLGAVGEGGGSCTPIVYYRAWHIRLGMDWRGRGGGGGVNWDHNSGEIHPSEHKKRLVLTVYY